MRCLEEICQQDLIEEDTIELLGMNNSDIDIFMTNEEYAAACEADTVKPLESREDYGSHIEDGMFRDMTHDQDDDVWFKSVLHSMDTDDDNALDINSIISKYDGNAELEALSKTEVNKEYDMSNGEEKYDG